MWAVFQNLTSWPLYAIDKVPIIYLCTYDATYKPVILTHSIKKIHRIEELSYFPLMLISTKQLFFCGAGDQTQGLVHVRQEFYHWVYPQT
jgi:hypothetical protein